MARPSKLTKEVQDIIIKGIEGGLTYEQSARLAGISDTTFYRWKRDGEKAKSGKYHQFWETIKRANIKARAVLLERINNAGAGGNVVNEVREVHDASGNLIQRTTTTKQIPPIWQASAWILERRFPSEFGKHIAPQLPEDRDPIDDWLDALIEAETEYSEK